MTGNDVANDDSTAINDELGFYGAGVAMVATGRRRRAADRAGGARPGNRGGRRGGQGAERGRRWKSLTDAATNVPVFRCMSRSRRRRLRSLYVALLRRPDIEACRRRCRWLRHLVRSTARRRWAEQTDDKAGRAEGTPGRGCVLLHGRFAVQPARGRSVAPPGRTWAGNSSRPCSPQPKTGAGLIYWWGTKRRREWPCTRGRAASRSPMGLGNPRARPGLGLIGTLS